MKMQKLSLISITNQKLETYMDEGDDIWVYVGRPTCDDCEKFIPVLKKVLKRNNMNMYYYNTDEARAEDEKLMVSILEKLEIKMVPTIVHLKNGIVEKKIIDYHDEGELINLLYE